MASRECAKGYNSPWTVNPALGEVKGRQINATCKVSSPCWPLPLDSDCAADDGPPAHSAVRVVHSGLETRGALEARRVTDVERVCVDVIVDTLNRLDLAVQELAEEVFSDLLLGNGVDTHRIPRPL